MLDGEEDYGIDSTDSWLQQGIPPTTLSKISSEQYTMTSSMAQRPETNTETVSTTSVTRSVKVARSGVTDTSDSYREDTELTGEHLQPYSVTSGPGSQPRSHKLSPNVASVTVITQSREDFEDIPRSMFPQKQHVQTVIQAQSESIIPRGQVLHVSAVVHPASGAELTLPQAIQAGLLDIYSGQFRDPKSGRTISLSEAVRLGYISKDFVKDLNQKCGLRDPTTGHELSLLEAMQKGLINPVTGKIKDPKTGEQLTPEQACARGLLSEEAAEKLSFVSISTSSSSHNKGYYGLSNVSGVSLGLSLSQALAQGLYDNRLGRFIDPVSREELTLQDAIQRKLIDPTVAEIVHPVTGERLSLEAAISEGVVDPVSGRFRDLRSGKQISLLDARDRQLIQEKVTLTEAATAGILDESGQFWDSRRCRRLTLMEAIERGLLDTDTKCILDPRTEELLSLSEAIARGLINPQGKFVHPTTGQELSIQAAVNQGLAQLLQENIHFPERGVQDTITEETITMSEAIARGYIDPSRGVYINKSTGREMSIDDAVAKGLISHSLAKQLQEPSGLRDIIGKELSVLEALKRGLIDHKSGRVIDPSSGRNMSIEDAVGAGVLDPTKARTLMELTSSVVKTTTVTTDIQTSKRPGTDTEQPDTEPMSVVPSAGAVQAPKHAHSEDTEEYVRDIEGGQEKTTKTQRQDFFTRKTDTGFESVAIHEAKMMQVSSTKTSAMSGELPLPLSVVDAITHGLLNTDTGMVRDPRTGDKLELEEAFHKGLLQPQSVLFNDPKSKKSMPLVEAIQMGKVDTTGHYYNIQTRSTLNLEELMRQGIVTTSKVPILPGSGKVPVISEKRKVVVKSVLDPATGEEIDPDEAIRRGILDMAAGIYINPLTGERLTIQEALERELLKAESGSLLKSAGDFVTTKAIKETHSYTITGAIDPTTGQKVNIDYAIQKGIIDQANSQYIGLDSRGKETRMPISEAIKKGLVVTQTGPTQTDVLDSGPKFMQQTKTFTIKGVIDPVKRVQIPVSEAIRKGILDQGKGQYVNPATGETMLITEAVQRGLVVADIRSTTSASDEGPSSKLMMQRQVAYTLKSVIHPVTGKEISLDEAVKQGILDRERGEYRNLDTGEIMSLSEAIDRKLLNVEIGKPDEEEPGELKRVPSVHIDDELDALEEMAVEEITEERKTFQISGVHDPRSGDMIPFAEGMELGLIDEDNGVYRNIVSGENIPITEAINQGLISGKLVSKTAEQELFRSALIASRIAGEDINIQSVLNPITGLRIPVTQAIHMGLVDRDMKTYYNPVTEKRYDIEEAVRRGWVNPTKKDLEKLSFPVPRVPTPEPEDMLPEPSTKARAVIDWATGTVRNSVTGQRMSTQEAMDQGLMDEATAKLLSLKAETMPFRGMSGFGRSEVIQISGAEQTLLDGQQGAVIDSTHDEENDMVTLTLQTTELVGQPLKSITVEESMETSSVTTESTSEEIPQVGALSFENAVLLGLYDIRKGQFRDPLTMETISLREALNRNCIDRSAPALTDIKTAQAVTLEEAINHKLVIEHTGRVNEAVARTMNITLDPQFTQKEFRHPAMNLEDAVLCGLLNPDTGEFRDPRSGNTFCLGEAVSKGLLHGEAILIVDPNTGDRCTLRAALADNILDKQTGSIMDTKQKVKLMSLTRAIKAGLVESVYKPDTACVVHRDTGEHVPIGDAVYSGVVAKGTPAVYEPESRKRISFSDANKKRVMDTDGMIYTAMNLKLGASPAAKRGLIVLPGAPVIAGMGIAQAIKKAVHTEVDTIASLEKAARMKERILEEYAEGHIPALPQARPEAILPDQVDVSVVEAAPKAAEMKTSEVVTEKTPVNVTIQDGEISASQKLVMTTQMRRAREVTHDAIQEVTKAVAPPPKQELPSIADTKYTPAETPKPVVRQQTARTDEIDMTFSDDVQYIPQKRPDRIGSEITIETKSHGPEIDIGSLLVKEHEPPSLVTIAETRTTVRESSKKDRHIGRAGSPQDEVYEPETVSSLPSIPLEELRSSTITDTKTGEKISMETAIERGLVDIDWDRGIITNCYTGQKMTPEEAFEQGLIDSHIAHLIETRMKKLKGYLPGKVTLNEAATRGLLIVPLGRVCNPATGQRMTLEEAIDVGFLDPDLSIIIDPATGRVITLTDAIATGLMDPHSGDVQNQATGKTLTLTEMSLEGLIPEFGLTRPDAVPFAEAVQRGWINLKSGTYTDPNTGEVMDVDEAMKLGYLVATESELHVKITEQTRTETKGHSRPEDDLSELQRRMLEARRHPRDAIHLDVAIEMGIVDGNTGAYTDPVTGEVMMLAMAISLGYIKGPRVKVSSHDEDIEGIDFEEAMSLHLIDIKNNTFKEPVTEVLMPLDAAIRKGFVILPEGGVKVKITEAKEETLSKRKQDIKTAIVVEGSQIHELPAQQERLAIGTGPTMPMSFAEGLEKGLIDLDRGQFTHPVSGERMTITEAIRQQLIDPTSEPVNPDGAPLTLTEAISRGYFNEEGGVFTHPQTGRRMSLSDAIDAGFIDKHSLLYDTATNKQITLDQAIKEGVIDPRTGRFIDAHSGRKISVKDAAKLGLLAIVGAPFLAGKAVVDAVSQSLDRRSLSRETSPTKSRTPDRQPQPGVGKEPEILEFTRVEETSTQLDSKHGMSLAEALKREELNTTTGKLFDTETGRLVSFGDALNQHLINPASGKVVLTEGKGLPLDEALSRGVMDAFGRVRDSTGVSLTLDAALRKRVVRLVEVQTTTRTKVTRITETIQLAVHGVFDSSIQREVSLSEARNAGVIDNMAGVYVDLRRGEPLPISEAYDRGLIKGDILDSKTSKEEMITDSASTPVLAPSAGAIHIQSVIDPATEKPINIEEARHKGIINESTGQYIDPRTGESMSLDDAVEAGLVITTETITATKTVHRVEAEQTSSVQSVTITAVVDARTGKELPVQQAIEEGLLTKETGQYIHPVTGEVIPLEKALELGFVIGEKPKTKEIEPEEKTFTIKAVKDPSTGLFLTPDEAADKGLLDMERGLYIDLMTGQTVKLVEAMSMGFVQVESHRSVDIETISESHTMERRQEKLTFSIKEVIDDRNGQRLHPSEAVDRGILDLARGLYISMKTGETIAIHEAYEKGLVIAEEAEPEDESPAVSATAVLETKSYTITAAIDTRNNERVGVSEAVRRGIIDQEMAKFVDLRTMTACSIKEAIDRGWIIAEEGHKTTPSSSVVKETKSYTIKSVIDPRTGEEIPISDAIRHKIVDKVKGQYWNMKTDEILSIDEAIHQGLIKAEPLESAIEKDARVEIEGMAATRIYALKSVRDINTDEDVDPVEAERRGLINKIVGIYIDPITGDKMSIRDAIRRGLIQAMEIEEPDYEDLPEDATIYATMEAIREKQTMNISTVIDLRTGEEISIMEAVRRGIIDPKTGQYVNTVTSDKMTVSDAYAEGLVKAHVKKSETSTLSQTPKLTRVFNITNVVDPRSGQVVSVTEAIERGLLDVASGQYIHPMTGQRKPFSQAAAEGLLRVDGDTSHMTSHEMQSMEFKLQSTEAYHSRPDQLEDYPQRSAPDTTQSGRGPSRSREGSPTRSMAGMDSTMDTTYPWSRDGSLGRSFTDRSDLLDDLSRELAVIETSSVAPQPRSRPLMKYSEALQSGLIDQSTNQFIHPHTGEHISVEEAVKSGLIMADMPVLLEKTETREYVTRRTEETTTVDIMKIDQERHGLSQVEDQPPSHGAKPDGGDTDKTEVNGFYKTETSTFPGGPDTGQWVRRDRPETSQKDTTQDQVEPMVGRGKIDLSDMHEITQMIETMETETQKVLDENRTRVSPQQQEKPKSPSPKPVKRERSKSPRREAPTHEGVTNGSAVVSTKGEVIKETTLSTYIMKPGYKISEDGIVINMHTGVTMSIGDAIKQGVLDPNLSGSTETDTQISAILDQVGPHI